MYSEISAVTKLSKIVWVPILIGYLVVFLSFITGFEPPSSGAVLVGTCIVAEITWARLLWRRGAMYYGNELIVLNNSDDPSSFFSTEGKSVSGVAKELSLLKEIAINKSHSRDRKMWRISTSLDSFDTIVALVIGMSAILGTLIWGYAHIFLPVVCECA